MKKLLAAVVVVFLGAGLASAFILGFRAIFCGINADLLGPAIAVTSFLLPATIMAIPLMDPPFSVPPQPPTPWEKP